MGTHVGGHPVRSLLPLPGGASDSQDRQGHFLPEPLKPDADAQERRRITLSRNFVLRQVRFQASVSMNQRLDTSP